MATALNYARSGRVDWVVAAQFISGGVLGGILGMLHATRLSAGKATLNRVFAALILTVAAFVIMKNLRAVIGEM
ncbi:putative membrane protein YfcA [Bosea sp. BE271]|nr:putative membrane protein YfcA [Bosea robiniae]MDR6898050.1 putative membrane protein YfcA [Bosea sp. BE109]MDR7141443.1 putative membrane protein YfcA [Bosea sp. BE168]MDR7178109.1 putative membrane protein YfcA [Bosea sp. BE271]